jgi:hypothetical protein
MGDMGGVVALRDTNGDGKFEMKEHFGGQSVTRYRAAERLPLHRRCERHPKIQDGRRRTNTAG